MREIAETGQEAVLRLIENLHCPIKPSETMGGNTVKRLPDMTRMATLQGRNAINVAEKFHFSCHACFIKHREAWRN